jgi:hypothetical protein
MSIVVRYTPEGMTKASYDQASSNVQDGAQWPPDGLMMHVCFGDEGDLKVSEIWASQEQFEAFSSRLAPVLERSGIRLAGPPQVFEVHSFDQL